MWGVCWPTGSPFPLSVTKWKLCLGAPKTKERWVPSAAYRIRIRPKKPLRAGKGFIPDHEYGICQQPRWPCRWWEQDAGLGPGVEGAQGAFIPLSSLTQAQNPPAPAGTLEWRDTLFNHFNSISIM